MMLLNEMINSIKDYDVPIFYFDKSTSNKDYCYSIVIPSEELAEIRGIQRTNTSDEAIGVYVKKGTPSDLYNHFTQNNKAAVLEKATLLRDTFGIQQPDIALAYSLFAILHEIGHIIHFRESKMSYTDYWYKFNGSRDDVWKLYQFCHHCVCETEKQRQMLQIGVNQIYENIPSEKYANEFALKEFMGNWLILVGE